MENALDQSLAAAEGYLQRIASRYCDAAAKERAELDMLNHVDTLGRLVAELNQDENRWLLERVLGHPYIRIARIRHLLQSVPLYENNKSDHRFKRLCENCDAAESTLRKVPEGDALNVGPTRSRRQLSLRRPSSGEYYYNTNNSDTDSDEDIEEDIETENMHTSHPTTQLIASDSDAPEKECLTAHESCVSSAEACTMSPEQNEKVEVKKEIQDAKSSKCAEREESPNPVSIDAMQTHTLSAGHRHTLSASQRKSVVPDPIANRHKQKAFATDEKTTSKGKSTNESSAPTFLRDRNKLQPSAHADNSEKKSVSISESPCASDQPSADIKEGKHGGEKNPNAHDAVISSLRKDINSRKDKQHTSVVDETTIAEASDRTDNLDTKSLSRSGSPSASVRQSTRIEKSGKKSIVRSGSPPTVGRTSYFSMPEMPAIVEDDCKAGPVAGDLRGSQILLLEDVSTDQSSPRPEMVAEQDDQKKDENTNAKASLRTAKSVQIQTSLPCGEKGPSRVNRQRQTLTSSAIGEPLYFAEEPRGPFTVVLDRAAICRGLGAWEDAEAPKVAKRGALTRMVDGVGMMAKASGLSHGNMYHTRKKILKLDGGVPDDGCTAISEVPIQKFGMKGQYAEIEVRFTVDSPIGCVGIGVTRHDPDSWRVMGLKFPERFDSFPAQSWVFGGPYRGSTCRLYVDGKKYYRYSMPYRENTKTLWTQGDRIGILIRNDNKLCLYLNSEVVVSVHTPGISTDLGDSDFYLVVEAYGYVRSVSIVPNAIPRGLDMPEDAESANVKS